MMNDTAVRKVTAWQLAIAIGFSLVTILTSITIIDTAIAAMGSALSVTVTFFIVTMCFVCIVKMSSHTAGRIAAFRDARAGTDDE